MTRVCSRHGEHYSLHVCAIFHVQFHHQIYLQALLFTVIVIQCTVKVAVIDLMGPHVLLCTQVHVLGSNALCYALLKWLWAFG